MITDPSARTTPAIRRAGRPSRATAPRPGVASDVGPRLLELDSVIVTEPHRRPVLLALDCESGQLHHDDHRANTAGAALRRIGAMLSEPEKQPTPTLLAGIDRVAGAATFHGLPLLGGTTRIAAGEQVLALERITTDTLGLQPRGDGGDDNRRVRDARRRVAAMFRRIADFQSTVLIPRLQSIGATVTGIIRPIASAADHADAVLLASETRAVLEQLPPSTAVRTTKTDRRTVIALLV